MTDLEHLQELERALDAAVALQCSTPEYREVKACGQRLSAFKRLMASRCTHPAERVTEFQWTHDDGYGKQSQMIGNRCSVCGAEKLWKSSTLWTKPWLVEDAP